MSLLRTTTGLAIATALAAATTVLSTPTSHAGNPRPDGQDSLAECPSNRFCTFSSPSYTGSVRHVGGTVVSRDLGWTTKSYWNNREQAARLYSNDASTSYCIPPGGRRTAVTPDYQTPDRVYLAGSANC